MPKKVVLVGHCGPDSSYLRMAVSKAARDVQIVNADDPQTLSRALNDGADLILLNRELGYGFDVAMGVDLIKRIRQSYPNQKMMLVSNYADAQTAAEHAGALPGFGKRELGSPRVQDLLKSALEA